MKESKKTGKNKEKLKTNEKPVKTQRKTKRKRKKTKKKPGMNQYVHRASVRSEASEARARDLSLWAGPICALQARGILYSL